MEDATAEYANASTIAVLATLPEGAQGVEAAEGAEGGDARHDGDAPQVRAPVAALGGDGDGGSAGASAEASAGLTALGGLQVFLSNFGPEAGASAQPWKPRARHVSLRIAWPAPPQSKPPEAAAGSGAAQSSAKSAVKSSEGCPLTAHALLRRIDDEVTNPWAVWNAQGAPQYLSAAQLAALHAASEVPVQTIALAVGKGPSPSECLGEVELELPAYGVAHLSGFGYE